jgi:glucokinase
MNTPTSKKHPSVSTPLFAGVDVGGTNVKIGIASNQGKIVAEGHFPTEQTKGPQFAIDNAAKELKQLAESAGLDFENIAAVGLGTPGTMDIPAGMILEPPNLSGWRNFNVRDGLATAVGRSVTYTNDANAAAYGEFWAGGGSEYESMVLFTLGTGVGGGIILGDHWIDGAHSHGAEVGHVVVDTSPDARMCGCGVRGHLEAYTSATAVVARAQERVAQGGTTSLAQVDELTALAVSEAAIAGDELALELVMETADYLARGVTLMLHIIDPQATILGGAMNFGGRESELGRQFLNRIETKVKKWTFPTLAKNLTIRFAQLGGSAGWVGAAGLSRVEHNQRKTNQNLNAVS